MEQIARDSRRTFHLHAMEPGEELPPAFDGAPYAALLWSTCLSPDPQRQRIAAALIASGCRFIACGGVEPEAWEDAADKSISRRNGRSPCRGTAS